MIPQKILITGASGLLGINALETLAPANQLFGTFLNHPIKTSNALLKKLDITQEKEVERLFDDIQPQVVIHTAALTNIDFCEKNKDLAKSNNVDATLSLAKMCQKHGSLFVFISTDAFFEKQGYLFKEEDEPAPMNYYGETKALAEEGIRKISSNHIIARTNFFGWNGHKKESLSEWITGQLRAQKTTTLFSDVSFTPVLVNTLCEALQRLVSSQFKGTINIAGSDFLTKEEFGQRLATEFSLDKNLIKPTKIESLGLDAPRSQSMGLCTKKLEAHLNQQKMPLDLSLETGLRQLHQLESSGYARKLKEAASA